MNTLDLLSDGYDAVYASLAELRETFHRSGRLDDSNAKLDEVAKLFATYLAYRRGLLPSFPDVASARLVSELQSTFKVASKLPQYVWSGTGRSIFGEDPKLVLRDEDQPLAQELVMLVRQCVDLAFDCKNSGRPFDILNEAFGHFVRDNFRGNVEDAQYMTPPEVVEFIVDVALSEIKSDLGSSRSEVFSVLDPSCGVGSFLTAFYNRSRSENFLPLDRVRLIGQDKVERMARLATINLELFDVSEHRIEIGNSLEKGSVLDALNGSIDLILTNPPFGARFSGDEVRHKCGSNTPFFSSLRKNIPSIDSELLFIDRYLELLRDGGRLIVVVPDGVISAKGTAALLRQYLSTKATLKAVIELPAVTFAQAGTRTKTSILYIQKGRSKQASNTFMSVANDLGFQVSSRKGVQVKQTEGENNLLPILSSYIESEKVGPTDFAEVLRRSPSCVLVNESKVLRGSWTPGHYSAERLDAIALVEGSMEFDMVPLRDLVEFCADTRKVERWEAGSAFISILHVLGEGFIDISSAQGHAPKTPGIPTFSGEILLSRINPRIPRVCVTPEFGKRTLCSSEFEVLSARPGVDPYLLAYLLLTDVVQKQICSLTSGTSASHNRIRTSELATVLMPMPKRGTSKCKQLDSLAAEYRDALQLMASSSIKLAKLRARESDFI